MLDDPRVGIGDDKDGDRRGKGKEDGKVGMGCEGGIGLGRTVRGGGETVRPEADPGEDRDEGDLVEEGGVGDVPLGSDEGVTDPGRDALRFRLVVLWCQGLPLAGAMEGEGRGGEPRPDVHGIKVDIHP
jgi:hypothetical protein